MKDHYIHDYKQKCYWPWLVAIALAIALAHTLSYNDAAAAASCDPIPAAHGGLGCITDTECDTSIVDESIDDELRRAHDNIHLSINRGD